MGHAKNRELFFRCYYPTSKIRLSSIPLALLFPHFPTSSIPHQFLHIFISTYKNVSEFFLYLNFYSLEGCMVLNENSHKNTHISCLTDMSFKWLFNQQMLSIRVHNMDTGHPAVNKTRSFLTDAKMKQTGLSDKVTQVEEHKSSMCKTVTSIPSTKCTTALSTSKGREENGLEGPRTFMKTHVCRQE